MTTNSSMSQMSYNQLLLLKTELKLELSVRDSSREDKSWELEVDELMSDGKLIEAVQKARKFNDWNLREARAYCEQRPRKNR